MGSKRVDLYKSISDKRLYEIDIEKPLSETLVSFLHTLADIIKKNKVFISCSHTDRTISDIITSLLKKRGYDVIRFNSFKADEYEQHKKNIESISEFLYGISCIKIQGAVKNASFFTAFLRG